MPGSGQTLSRPTRENSHDVQVHHLGWCGGCCIDVWQFRCIELRPTAGADGSVCAGCSTEHRTDRASCTFCYEHIERRFDTFYDEARETPSPHAHRAARRVHEIGTRRNAEAESGSAGESARRIARPVRHDAAAERPVVAECSCAGEQSVDARQLCCAAEQPTPTGAVR